MSKTRQEEWQEFKPFVILIAISVVLVFIIIGISQRYASKQPILPAESKIETPKENLLLYDSPIFQKAMTKTLYDQIFDQLNSLGKENIKISPFFAASDKNTLEFLTKLQSCEKCKKIFAFFGSNDVLLILDYKNKVNTGFSRKIHIDVQKSPEEIADWLATGKVK